MLREILDSVLAEHEEIPVEPIAKVSIALDGKEIAEAHSWLRNFCNYIEAMLLRTDPGMVEVGGSGIALRGSYDPVYTPCTIVIGVGTNPPGYNDYSIQSGVAGPITTMSIGAISGGYRITLSCQYTPSEAITIYEVCIYQEVSDLYGTAHSICIFREVISGGVFIPGGSTKVFTITIDILV